MLMFTMKKSGMFFFMILLITCFCFFLGQFSTTHYFSFGEFWNYLSFLLFEFFPNLFHAGSAYPVTFEIFIPTFFLFFASLTIAIIIGFPIGIYLGTLSNSKMTLSVKILFLMLYACPIILLCILLGNLFSDIDLNQVDTYLTMRAFNFNHYLSEWHLLILPIVILSLFPSMMTIQIVSRNVENITQQNFVKVALIRNSSKLQLIRHHILPNVIPISIEQLLHYLSMVLFFTMTIELFFNLQGMGRVALNAYLKQDLFVISQLIWVCGIALSLIWFIVEFVIALLYPFTLSED